MTEPLLKIDLGDYSLELRGSQSQIGTAETFVTFSPPSPQLCIEALGKARSMENSGQVSLDVPLVVENSVYDIYLRGPGSSSLQLFPSGGALRCQYQSNSLVHYRLNYRSSVGDTTWVWATPSVQIQLGLEVFPTKLDYRRDFENIKRDISELSEFLIASPSGPTGSTFGPSASSGESQLEWLIQLHREAESLRRAVSLLLPRLRTDLQEFDALVPSDRIRRPRLATKRQAAMLASGRRRSVRVRTLVHSEATRLNGHLRWEIEQLRVTGSMALSSETFGVMDESIQASVRAVLEEADGWRFRLIDVKPVPVVPHLHTRLRDPLYAAAFSALRTLRLGLQEAAATTLVGLKDLALIYEYWVYLKVVERLQTLWPQIRQRPLPLIREVRGQLIMTRGSQAVFVLGREAGDAVRCTYNRSFGGLPTTNQRPDITIERESDGLAIIIDAKYRVARDNEYVNRYGQRGPEEEDINVLHRYRDAVVSATAPHHRLIDAGLIAFPEQHTEAFREHHFYRSWRSVRLGGVPMLPGHTPLLDEALELFLEA